MSNQKRRVSIIVDIVLRHVGPDVATKVLADIMAEVPISSERLQLALNAIKAEIFSRSHVGDVIVDRTEMSDEEKTDMWAMGNGLSVVLEGGSIINNEMPEDSDGASFPMSGKNS